MSQEMLLESTFKINGSKNTNTQSVAAKISKISIKVRRLRVNVRRLRSSQNSLREEDRKIRNSIKQPPKIMKFEP